MTIKEYIISGALINAKNRLENLQKLDAPAIMIANQKKIVEELSGGNLNIGGDVEVLEREFCNREFKTGRGGKQYIIINGNINFFPNAKYGMYIKSVI